MELTIKQTKYNVIAYLVILVIMIVLGCIETLLSDYSTILRWIFLFLSAGWIWYSAKAYLYQGTFNNNWWKIVFVLLFPFVYVFEKFIFNPLDWYNGAPISTYYIIYTVRFLITKIPSLDEIIEKQANDGEI